MTTLLLTYNPLLVRVGLAVLALLLAVLYAIFLVRRVQKRRSAKMAAASGHATHDSPVFGQTLPVGSSLLLDISRGILILLAICVAAGLSLIVLPEETINRAAEHLRLRSGQLPPQEQISLLYLGDELKAGEFHIRGVVRNISTAPIEKLDAVVRLYAADGALIETAVVRMDAEVIPPDATSTFHLGLPEESGKSGSYAVDFKLRQGDAVLYKDMRRGS